MSDVLKGSLEQLPLPAVLRLLATGAQTGRLNLRDGPRKGVIHLREGQLVHAVEGPNMGVTALNTLTSWPRGEFDFAQGAPCPEESISKQTDELLTETTERSEQWKRIRHVIPSTETVFKFAQGGISSSVNLAPEDWQVLTQVTGSVSVAGIAGLLSQDELEIAMVLARLADAGLLECVEAPQVAGGPAIAGTFLSRLETELVELMGPMAPMIIDEAIEALGEARSTLPRGKVAALIERIGVEIDSSEKRARFQQLMLGLLKQL